MKNNKGQALVEFIIVLPILLLIIMAIIDFGNIFTKKYSLENDLDTIVGMYKSQKHSDINSYISNKDISIKYENNNDFIVITLSKDIKINTPILNNIMGKTYKITTNKSIYKNE